MATETATVKVTFTIQSFIVVVPDCLLAKSPNCGFQKAQNGFHASHFQPKCEEKLDRVETPLQRDKLGNFGPVVNVIGKVFFEEIMKF